MKAVPGSPRLAQESGGEASDALYRYHLLRAASERFQRDLGALDTRRRAEASHQAQRTLDLENLVLGSREALGVVIPPERVDNALGELRARYPDAEAFTLDMARNGLTLSSLGLALRRELVFDAILQRVGARHPPVEEIDVWLYYELHWERLTRPERRTARHILITLNEAYPENRRAAVLARIEHLADQLRAPGMGGARRFANLAEVHSECPSALEQGLLGEVERGKLYPELDAVLFRLEAGHFGGPVETELGFHLIFCEHIHAATTPAFSQVREAIRARLVARSRRDYQKAWLAELRASQA
ncbi:MAG: nitrogen fixation protein NifM [Chromatiaceae bacterium]|nr:nitrogen fixation protein NifM [Chromatiaceae bacterium]MBP6734687.1 nitrogen fixation protein NifM [Chromatiaceae bacterium]MBP6806740.1 nitrogen fixation protein NifM [Chromatiaceae bacterium]MBP8288722.1 nitrogen fixation protein NifM [Chromatiaceae bacterium]MBP9602727.1 nitrogen fixation protein NifM [Chromatiaceae bacterium]